MLYYLLFWTLLGFIIHFYIIFWTNLLTGGLAQNCCFFAYFSVSKKRNIKRSPNGMKPSGTWFSQRRRPRRLGPYVKTSTRKARGRGRALHPRGAHVAPPTYSFLLYTYVPPNDQIRSQNPNSTVVTFCIHEIPSWGLFQSSARGGIHYGGLLNQDHSLSDEVWVVYLRPSGP